MVDRCWIVGVGESWSEWFAGCQREWGAWWNRRRCSVNSHHMGGTVCICRDPWISYRKSLSFLWKNLLPSFIYICFVNEGLRGKKIPLKLQIYTNTYISMIQVFFYSSKYEKKNAIQNASIVEIFGLELLENTVYETKWKLRGN